MKRWLAIGVISSYLSLLTYGVGCHTLGYGVTQHPLMYFIVWDMFCGWAAYASQTHIIAEGESQKFYELAPAPWGEMNPYGAWGRHHYDSLNNHAPRIALNTLRHTQHEPITRIFVIEESWSKKYDLPDSVWARRYGGEKQPRKYCWIRSELAPDGTPLKTYMSFLAWQQLQAVAENPRLQADAVRTRPMFLVEPGRFSGNGAGSELPEPGGWSTRNLVGAPLGN